MTRRRLPALVAAVSESVAGLARLQAEIAQLSTEARVLLARMEEMDAAAGEVTGEALRWLRERELALCRRCAGREEWDREMAAADEAAAIWWHRAMAVRGFGEAEAPPLN